VTLELILRQVCILRSRHLHKSEASALAGVWISHNVALLHYAVFSEQFSNLLLAETWVDAGDKEVGSRVDRVLRAAVLVREWIAGGTSVHTALDIESRVTSSPISAPIHGLVANAGIAVAIWTWRARAFTPIVSLICRGECQHRYRGLARLEEMA
jgi:hypothetical protein